MLTILEALSRLLASSWICRSRSCSSAFSCTTSASSSLSSSNDAAKSSALSLPTSSSLRYWLMKTSTSRLTSSSSASAFFLSWAMLVFSTPSRSFVIFSGGSWSSTFCRASSAFLYFLSELSFSLIARPRTSISLFRSVPMAFICMSRLTWLASSWSASIEASSRSLRISSMLRSLVSLFTRERSSPASARACSPSSSNTCVLDFASSTSTSLLLVMTLSSCALSPFNELVRISVCRRSFSGFADHFCSSWWSSILTF
mmetsp:Transcript_38296/g.108284  ORF Transcript_38296/g.108284 Transcript_38296/m.108284 type:complete len:258 (+) Transcript_38296:1598-2371(+)